MTDSVAPDTTSYEGIAQQSHSKREDADDNQTACGECSPGLLWQCWCMVSECHVAKACPRGEIEHQAIYSDGKS